MMVKPIMSRHLLALVSLLLYADIVYSKVHYITHSPNGPCPQNFSCLTLSQFAANSSYNETHISLLLLPGNHTLDQELFITRLSNFSTIKYGLDSETVFVDCSTHYGRFRISETTSVSLNHLHFISCGSNSVSQVKWLTITDTTFQGVQNRNTVLELNEVSNATIVETRFLSNSLNYPNISRLTSINEQLDYVYFQRNTTNGALYTSFCNVSIISSKFMHNRADIGGALVVHNSRLQLAGSTYSNNTANFGGVMVTSGSTINMDNNTFINNAAAQSGGVMVTYNDTFTISSTTFNNNSAGFIGGVMVTFGDSSFVIKNSTLGNNSAGHGAVMATFDYSSLNITNSMFTNNRADQFGGVMITSGNSSFNITNSMFTNNRADQFGGVMGTFSDSSFNISNSMFMNNRADQFGGVMITNGSSFNISNSMFTYNRADQFGGVMGTFGDSSFNISNSMFTNNRADQSGGVIITNGSSFNISNSMFMNNRADQLGGVMYTDGDSFNINNSTLNNNSAALGGVIYCLNGTFDVDNGNFNLNTFTNQGGGIILMLQCSTHISNSTFDQNIGSLYMYNSKLTLSGYLKFDNFTEALRLGNGTTSERGGAIISFQSTVIFARESIVYLSNNRASQGGAILASDSTIVIYGETTIANNVANVDGGGISLKQSRLEIKGSCQIVNNVAVRGGGIHASSSTIAVHQPGTLQVTNNSAAFGGGLYLEVNPKLYVLKNIILVNTPNNESIISCTGNRAKCGGGIYVADDTNSGACSPDNECFIQTLALSPQIVVNIFFSENIASKQESNLFGGLLDRCVPSLFAEVYDTRTRLNYTGVTYLGNISNIELHSISSDPVRICFCNSEHEPDCRYQPPTIRVQKGKEFNVSLVAVDQVNHTVDANISSVLFSPLGGFGEDQQTQIVRRYCTNLTFNVFSPHDSVTLKLYPNGPCRSATLSTSHVTIKFMDCTCPVGFQPLSNNQSSSRCECDCDIKLSPYITDCDVLINSVFRKGFNSWITYINDTNPPGYVIEPNCPLDYCQPQTQSVTINFNLPNGADSQCAYDHTGVLCGACKEDLSLSLASSLCVPCHTYWPAVFVVILLAAAVAGILLVAALLALNMTVSVGLINGFILYANIASAGNAIFLPSSNQQEFNFPSLFVAWLNLDIGIDVCFIDGLDAYTKTWLQLTFPIYIISLVVMVIILSEYSPRFARLIGKKDPVSTLATLILLSYAKLLSITTTALSFAILHYPDGKQDTVWLPDGNVPYFQGKHIPLALVALLIIIVGLPYTILLFLWQWIVHAPKWKVFKWTRNTKLNNFIATYHVPHNSKYRYWTGLLLLVRVVLYIVAAATVSANPQTFALITGILVGGLILFKSLFGLRVYKRSVVDMVDTVLYFNVSALALFSLYDFNTNITKQKAVAYTSTIITFILFIAVIFYHVFLLIKKEKPPEDLNEYPLSPVKPAKVTHSIIEPPKRDDQDPPPADSKDSDEQEITEDRQIVTPQ